MDLFLFLLTLDMPGSSLIYYFQHFPIHGKFKSSCFQIENIIFREIHWNVWILIEIILNQVQFCSSGDLWQYLQAVSIVPMCLGWYKQLVGIGQGVSKFSTIPEWSNSWVNVLMDKMKEWRNESMNKCELVQVNSWSCTHVRAVLDSQNIYTLEPGHPKVALMQPTL